MTNMGMASGRKVHPLYFSDICVTEKRSGEIHRQTFFTIFRVPGQPLPGSGRCP
mgnify:CR=1 FL=1